MNTLFITWDVDPAFITIGSFELRYYALFWMAAFLVGSWIFAKMLKRENLDLKLLDSIFIYAFISTIAGARLGHCLFYDFDYYSAHPWQILNLRQGGLASHGAAFGMLVGLWLFARKNKVSYLWTLDRVTVVIPAGGALIRLGNLMNSEIYGTPTDLPWGFNFIRDRQWHLPLQEGGAEELPCHPTQIYEALIYLLIFLLLMYLYFKKDEGHRHPGLIFATFLITLFLGRFIVETIKNPQSPFEVGMTFNMGQILSLPFILAGIVLFVLAYRHKLGEKPSKR